jgi:hypothetical protein
MPSNRPTRDRGGRTAARQTTRTTKRNRERDAVGQALDPKSLVGSYFYGDPTRQWQGTVVAEAAPTVYLVEIHDWLVGASLHQELVRLEDMAGWRFYDTSEWMSNAYRDGVEREWERFNKDREHV